MICHFCDKTDVPNDMVVYCALTDEDKKKWRIIGQKNYFQIQSFESFAWRHYDGAPTLIAALNQLTDILKDPQKHNEEMIRKLGFDDLLERKISNI